MLYPTRIHQRKHANAGQRIHFLSYHPTNLLKLLYHLGLKYIYIYRPTRKRSLVFETIIDGLNEAINIDENKKRILVVPEASDEFSDDFMEKDFFSDSL